MNPEIQRVTRPRARARQSYNSMSRWYDIITGGESRFIEMGIRMLEIQRGESVLEIGCGTGRALTEFARLCAGGLSVGLDISEDMLRVARSRVAHEGFGEQVENCQADGLSLPFEAERFDALFLSFTLELFDTPELPLITSECQRVLKEHGRIAVVTLAQQDRFAVRLYEWSRGRIPDYLDCRPIFVRPILENAGFAISQLTTESMWGLPVDIAVARKQPAAGV